MIAAVRKYAPAFSGELPDTGELRADVLALLRRAAERNVQLGRRRSAACWPSWPRTPSPRR